MTTTDRSEYTKSLRAFADLIDANDIPLPYQARELTFYVHHSLDDALAIRDLMQFPVTTREIGAFPVQVAGTLAGMQAQVHIHGRIALLDVQPVEAPMDPRLENPSHVRAVSS